jgi:hypothetical protein
MFYKQFKHEEVVCLGRQDMREISLRKCQRPGCKKSFIPDVRHKKDQKCCSSYCRKIVKRYQDRLAAKKYRKTKKGRITRRKQARRYRLKIDWADYMRKYRKKNLKRVRAINCKSSHKYYRDNRRKIAFRRLERRQQK